MSLIHRVLVRRRGFPCSREIAPTCVSCFVVMNGCALVSILAFSLAARPFPPEHLYPQTGGSALGAT